MNAVILLSLFFCSSFIIVYCESDNQSQSSTEDKTPIDSRKTAIENDKSSTKKKSAASMEAEELLEDEGIKNADPNVKRLAKKYVKQEKRHKKELIEQANKMGRLEGEKERALNKSLEAFVVPYLCQKTELYLDLWGRDAQSESSTITNSASDSAAAHTPQDPPLKHDLDSQTRSSYRNNAKKILSILLHSKDPRVIAFKEKIMGKYSGFTLQNVADNFGLAVALLHNCKHGVLANDPDLAKLLNPENVVQALKKWHALNKDDVLLNILKAFEEATSPE